jgi:hypothetical protein
MLWDTRPDRERYRREIDNLRVWMRAQWSLKRLCLSAFAIVGFVTVIVFSLHWWTVGRFIESTDDTYVGGDVTVISPRSPVSSPRSPFMTTRRSAPVTF